MGMSPVEMSQIPISCGQGRFLERVYRRLERLQQDGEARILALEKQMDALYIVKIVELCLRYDPGTASRMIMEVDHITLEQIESLLEMPPKWYFAEHPDKW